MKRLLLILALLPLAGCGPEEYTWNQRLTVTVQTPNGPVSGSTVYPMFGTVYTEGGQAVTGSAARYGYRGEVAIVDLGEERYIFASPIVSGDALYSLDPARYPELGISDRAQWLPLALEDRTPLVVPDNRYPRLITFGDIDDPLTVNIFEAQEVSAIFGDGDEIASMEWQVVEDAPTSGRVLEVLPWSVDIWPLRLDGGRGFSSRSEYPDANRLGAGSFSNEIRDWIEDAE